MVQQPGLEDIMASEVKRQIASRYFGFRKLIEEDSQDYTQKIREHSLILEKRISFDLMRIYLLLRQEKLIQQFLDLVGIDERLFFDPYLLESPTLQQRIFECQRFKGWSRKGRFIRYFFTCYDNLAFHVKIYDCKLQELAAFHDGIVAEIETFYQQNDISAILSFLRSLGDKQATGAMQGGMEIGLAESLDQKLKVKVPAPIEQILPVIKPLPSLGEIKGPFKKMLKEAYRLQIPEILVMFDTNSTPCPLRKDYLDM